MILFLIMRNKMSRGYFWWSKAFILVPENMTSLFYGKYAVC